MQVINSEQTYKVYWMYNSSVLAQMLKHYRGADYDDVMSLPFKKQMEMCKGIEIPIIMTGGDIVNFTPEEIVSSPDTTHCFLVNVASKTTEAQSSVKRYYKDPEDRNKARKYSLAKLLKEFSFSKEERTKFWEVYLKNTQTAVVPMAIVK